jgi:hypothetical protein
MYKNIFYSTISKNIENQAFFIEKNLESVIFKEQYLFYRKLSSEQWVVFLLIFSSNINLRQLYTICANQSDYFFIMPFWIFGFSISIVELSAGKLH